jgi:putative Holliday junction resolvase
MQRLLAIDFGSRRIGLALSDPLQIIARPFAVLINDESIFQKLSQIVADEKISRIIVGLPVNMEGEDTPKTLEVRRFTEDLKKKVAIPIEFWDERYTSEEARKVLQDMRIEPHQNKNHIDKVAASLILRDYMDNNPLK